MKKKLNVVDITIAVILLMIIFVVIYKFAFSNLSNSNNVNDLDTMSYTVCINGVRQPTVDALHIGDKLYDDTTETYLGKITSIKTESYTTKVSNIDGDYIIVEKPDYFNVYMDIEVPMLEKETGYFASGVVEIKTNSNLYTNTKYASPILQVVKINITE